MNPPGLFVVGTDTGVGKTRVTCWIAAHLRRNGLRVGVCKPAASGAADLNGTLVWDDIERLAASTGLHPNDERVGPFRWRLPLAPPVATRISGETILANGNVWPRCPLIADYVAVLDKWRSACDFLLIEGIGGILCPLTDRETVAELALAAKLPILIVARSGLGTLNHTLLTVEAAIARGLAIVAIVLNQTAGPQPTLADETSAGELRRRLTIPTLGPIPYLDENSEIPALLAETDWLQLVSEC